MHMISMEIYGDTCFLYSKKGKHTHTRAHAHTMHNSRVNPCQLNTHLHSNSRYSDTRLQGREVTLSIFTEAEMVTQPVFSFLHSTHTWWPQSGPQMPGAGSRPPRQSRGEDARPAPWCSGSPGDGDKTAQREVTYAKAEVRTGCWDSSEG